MVDTSDVKLLYTENRSFLEKKELYPVNFLEIKRNFYIKNRTKRLTYAFEIIVVSTVALMLIFLGLFGILNSISFFSGDISSIIIGSIGELFINITAYVIGIYIGCVFFKVGQNLYSEINSKKYEEVTKEFVNIHFSSIGVVSAINNKGRLFVIYFRYNYNNDIHTTESYITNTKPNINIGDKVYVIYSALNSAIL